MIRLLFWALLLYLGVRIASTLKRKTKCDMPARRERGPVCVTHRDPVCGIYVTEDDAVVGLYNGQRLYFCSLACRDRYREHPDKR
jgi:YHS domain-containing protein